MNVEVTRDEIIIKEDSKQTHENEYNITTCYFTFDEFTNSFENKYAVFTLISNGISYQQDIINNQCEIPAEVLKHEYETIKLGVFGENIDNTGTSPILEDRFSPSYTTFIINTGSYQEGALSPEIITPSQYDLYSQALQEGLQEVDDKVDEVIDIVDGKIVEIDDAIQRTNNLDIDAEKVDKTTTITITKKDGTPEEVEILDGVDGVSLENIEIVDRNLKVTYGGETENLGQVAPNIQVGTTTTITPSMSARVENVGTDLNPIFNFYIPKGEAGSIKFEIVEQLPTQDIDPSTIYLVPYAVITVEQLPSTGNPNTIYIVSSTNKRYVYESNQWIEITSDNKYAEYLYINNEWEQIGGITVDIDLSDYYTKTETNTLLDNKQNKITNDNKLSASLVSGLSNVATSGNYNDLSNKPNLSVYELSSNKVTSLSSSSTDTQYPSAKCVYDLVGNLETILTTLDIGSGV